MDIRYKDEVVIVFMQNNVTFATSVLVKLKYLRYNSK